jgi:hypothetical protein
LISALVFLLAGAFALGNTLAWRLRAVRVTGTVIGAQSHGSNKYSTVYQYTDMTGRTIDASCNTWSAGLADKQTGLTRQLMVFADQPQQVREANTFVFEIVGAAFIVVGLMIAWRDGSTTALLDLVLGSLFGWYTFKRKVGPGVRAGTSPASAGQVSASLVSPVAREAAPLQRAEDILASSEVAQLAVGRERRNGTISTVTGVVMFAVAAYAGRSMAQLEIAGLHAPGKVLELVRESSPRADYAYYPVVRFTTASGASVQFKDNHGSNPVEYRVGDDVQVLYLPSASSTSAIIDRGIWNWVLPGAFGLAGAVLIALGMRQIAAARSARQLLLQSRSIPLPVASTSGAADLPLQMEVTSKTEASRGLMMQQANPRLARRIFWLVRCFFIGWPLWIASVIVPSPKAVTGFGPALLMFAPSLGTVLLFCGQALAVVAVIVRILVSVMPSSQASASRAVDGSEAVGLLARMLDAVLTCTVVMMAGGCVLIAIGLGARLTR